MQGHSQAKPINPQRLNSWRTWEPQVYSLRGMSLLAWGAWGPLLRTEPAAECGPRITTNPKEHRLGVAAAWALGVAAVQMQISWTANREPVTAVSQTQTQEMTGRINMRRFYFQNTMQDRRQTKPMTSQRHKSKLDRNTN